jgi:hypothetical protein
LAPDLRPDRRADCSTPRHSFGRFQRHLHTARKAKGGFGRPVIFRHCEMSDPCFARPAFGRSGGDLLSHALRRSTIGAEGFHGRVRNGIGCGPLAKTTRPSKRAAPSASLLRLPSLRCLRPLRTRATAEAGSFVLQLRSLAFGGGLAAAHDGYANQAARGISTG